MFSQCMNPKYIPLYDEAREPESLFKKTNKQKTKQQIF